MEISRTTVITYFQNCSTGLSVSSKEMFIEWGSDSLKGSLASGFQHFSLAQEPSVDYIF